MQSPKAFMLAAHGAKMPAIGFGTMELPHRPAELVAAAIAAGYRQSATSILPANTARKSALAKAFARAASHEMSYSSPPR